MTDDAEPIAVSYRLLFPERQEKLAGALAERVSYGGLLLRAREPLAVGSLLEVEIGSGQAGAETGLKLIGEVKWLEAHEDGEHFLAGVFFLLPTAGRMFELFMLRNRDFVEKPQEWEKKDPGPP